MRTASKAALWLRLWWNRLWCGKGRRRKRHRSWE